MKIVHDLPPKFIEKMHSCDDQDVIKTFSGKTLLKIADLGIEKQRREVIDTIIQQIEERK